MTINYTTLLGLAKPVTGTETGQWGDVVNNEITSLLEDAVANAATFSVTSGNVTLTTTNGTSNQARMSTLIVTGTPGTTRNVIAPSQAKVYVVINQSDSSVVIKGAATTGITVAAGQTAQVAWNGSDFVEVGNYVNGSFVINGNLTVNGNTTLGDASGDSVTINAGTTTFVQGTANGVLYLNGSKVATSGSALTWNGSTLLVGGNTRFGSGAVIPGFATASDASLANNASLRGTNAAGSTAFELIKLNTSDQVVINNDGADAVLTSAATSIRWTIGSEQMRLTSTGLGIGTSSPTNKLDVYQGTAGTGAAKVLHVNGNGITINPSYNYYDAYNHIFRSLSGTTTYATIDNSGNLGLGVTPSAYWTSAGSQKAFQIGSYAALSSSGTGVGGYYQTVLGMNCVDHTTSTKYLNNGYSTAYVQLTGQHQWLTAPSGTAGNAISFTQAMTLDASGRLQVATTNATGTNAKLVVAAGNAGSNGVIVANTANGAYPGIFVSNWTGSATTQGPYIGFDNSGVGGWYIGSGNATNTFDICQTWGTPLARIDSSGNFLVGTTSAKGVGITVESSSNTIWTTSTNSGQSALVVQNSNGGAVNLVAFQTGSGTGSGVGSIYYSSGLTVYATTSDYRLKTVIGNLTGHGERIDALEPIEYEWITDGSRTRGFLAHKFQEVYPSSVSGTKDAVDANGKPVYQGMQAGSSEVIADLVAEIKSLRARVASLEFK